MKSNSLVVFKTWFIREGRDGRDEFFKSTIQISLMIVERHPKKMGIKMWINRGMTSGIQDRQRV